MEEWYKILKYVPKKKTIILISIFMVFESIFIFPLKYELSILNALFIYCYFMLGFLLGIVIDRKPVIVIWGISLCNLVGLGLRVLLEWGESSIDRELTMLNVLSTYIPIIVVTLIGYCHRQSKARKVEI